MRLGFLLTGLLGLLAGVCHAACDSNPTYTYTSRAGITIPPVNACGWGTTLNNDFTLIDTSMSILNQSNVYTGLNTFNAALIMGTAKPIQFYDLSTHYVSLQASPTVTTTNWILPSADGTVGQVLQTDGTGNLSFVSPGGASTLLSSNNTWTGNNAFTPVTTFGGASPILSTGTLQSGAQFFVSSGTVSGPLMTNAYGDPSIANCSQVSASPSSPFTSCYTADVGTSSTVGYMTEMSFAAAAGHNTYGVYSENNTQTSFPGETFGGLFYAANGSYVNEGIHATAGEASASGAQNYAVYGLAGGTYGNNSIFGVYGNAEGAGTGYGGYFVATSTTTSVGAFVQASTHAIQVGGGDIYTNGTAGTNGQVLQSRGNFVVPAWTTAILSTNTLQSGTTFFVSSGTVSGPLAIAGSSASPLTFGVGSSAGVNTYQTNYLDVGTLSAENGWANSQVGFFWSQGNNSSSTPLLNLSTQNGLLTNVYGINAGSMTITSSATVRGGILSSSGTVLNGNVNISSSVLLSGLAGTNGQILTSGGVGTVPTWTNVASGSLPLPGGATNYIQVSTGPLQASSTFYVSSGTVSTVLYHSSAAVFNGNVTISSTVIIGSTSGINGMVFSSSGAGTAPMWSFSHLLQAPVKSSTTAATTTSAQTFQNTGLSVGITPSTTTSCILLMVHGDLTAASPISTNAAATITGTTSGELSGNALGLIATSANTTNQTDYPTAMVTFDCPRTTSAQTYTVQILSTVAAQNVTWNRAGATSVIIATEVR